MLNELTKRQFCTAQLIAAGFTFAYLQNEQYLAASLVFVFGVIFCTLLDKLQKADKSQ